MVEQMVVNQEKVSQKPSEKPINQPGFTLKDGTFQIGSQLPDHLIELPGGRWAVWRCVGLRGAGFPAQQVLELTTPECAETADRLIRAEDKVMRAHSIAQDALDRELREITDDAERREALKKALRRINKNKLSEFLEFTGASKDAVDVFGQTRVEADAIQADYKRAFAAATDHISQVIYQVAGDNRFREAVTWQNRHALVTGVHPILREPPQTASRGSQRRQHEELIANYVQRYCVKNDTIGFFGPVGWARFVPYGHALTANPGPNLLASRHVYFEGWCIDALAEALAQNKALRPWIAPRRMPTIYQDGTTLYLPFKDPLKISAGQAAVLQACNGDRTAREIALQLLHTPSPGLESEAEAYDLLEQLQSMNLIAWTLEVPVETYPERPLRRLLERIEDEHIRQLNLRALDVLEKARSGVALAAGNADKLDQALNVMNTVFTRMTGISSTREAGKTYAARALVYEDCRRDIEIDIGPEILQALGPPLSLLLDSARWFTAEAATIYRQVVRQVYAEQVSQTGSRIVPLVNAWPKLQSILYNKDGRPVDSLLSVFQERWASILAIPPGARHIQYSSEELHSRVQAAFNSPQPGWSFTRCQAPDILVAASSVQAIQHGDYQLVMGELHMGRNTLAAAFFLAQHPSPEEIFQALAAEQPGPRVAPIVPKHWPDLTARTRPAFVLHRDFHLAATHDSYIGPEWQTLPIGAMVIEDTESGLVVRTRDRQLCFDTITVFADLVSDQVVNCFKMLAHGPYTPRITIDRLVVCRETWQFPVEELTFAYEKNEADRFVASRRWAQAHGLPRFVFAKTPIERKPFYIDFDSPIWINIFAKYIRRTKEQGSQDALITVTEMLPDPSQLWLPDAQDQRYTSELRIVAVDLKAVTR